MSSGLCQGLQTCLEPRLVEPRILMHKLAPPKSNLFQSLPLHENTNLYQNQDQEENNQSEKNFGNYDCNNCENQNKGGQLGGWSFIQSLTNTSHNSKQGTETEEVYVHPLVKRSSSTLSTKSLEMCTESLGSETGSDTRENIDEFASILMQKQNIHGLQRSKPRESSKKVDRTVNFPPPLTSINGSDGVQVRPHREDGRLVLKAVTVSSCNNSYFQAERADGRLRLSFLKGSDLNCDNELADTEENVCIEDSEEVTEHGYADKIEEEYCDDDSKNDADDDGEDDANGGSWEDDMKGNGEKFGCEIEVGDFPRPSRCKEGGNGNKGMPNWGTFWVPIS